jgi:hypothetical protein
MLDIINTKSCLGYWRVIQRSGQTTRLKLFAYKLQKKPFSPGEDTLKSLVDMVASFESEEKGAHLLKSLALEIVKSTT